MRLKTANNHARKARRRAVYRAGYQFHMARVIRLAKLDKLHLTKNSGFIRRQAKKDKLNASNQTPR